MAIAPSEVTIAITVYRRRDYVEQAIASALAQRTRERPRVVVVEDCGPDPSLRESIIEKFGDAIVYHRNAQRRGLFDNWNACLELCTTPWLSILHDDDFLEPKFIAAMQELSAAAPDRALYYGACRTIDSHGRVIIDVEEPANFSWSDFDLRAGTEHNPVCFPGHILHVPTARNLGGFRASSRYTGDWEMWFKLALSGGAACTNRIVANFREHHSSGRGTTDVNVSGRKYAYVNMQRKRHAAWLRRAGENVSFDRREIQRESPIPTRFLLAHAHSFHPRLLRYNAALLMCSKAPHLSYKTFQWLVRVFTSRSLRLISRLFMLRAHAD